MVGALTLVPFLGAPALYLLGLTGPHEMGSRAAWLVFVALTAAAGPGHVGSSVWFYFDPAYRPLMNRNKLRFYLSIIAVPILALAFAFVLFRLLGNGAFFIVVLGYTSWLFYHYQRQNFGLTALAGTSVGFGPMPKHLNTVLVMASIAGVFGVLGLANMYPNFVDWNTLVGPALRPWCRDIGIALYALSAAGFIYILATDKRILANPRVLGCALASEIFFLPALIFNDPLAAVVGFASAHGAQYLLMMSVTAERSKLGWWALGVVALGAVIWWKLSALMAVSGYLFMIVIGITMVHFLIDAKLWRLREPEQRAIVRERFSFLMQQ
jgi:hypothetical protein